MDITALELLSFDCYGTLVDWESGIVRAFESVLVDAGRHPEPDAILRAYAGAESGHQDGAFVSYREVLRRTAASMCATLELSTEALDPDLLVNSLPTWPVFPDTVASLRALAEHFELAVISNVDDELFAATARCLEVPFNHVVTAASVGAYKPDRRVFEAAQARFGRDGRTWLHCAQSRFHDIAPANAFGLPTAWVRRPSPRAFSAVPPAEARADLEVDGLAGLVRALESR